MPTCAHCDHDESDHMPHIPYSCVQQGCACRGFAAELEPAPVLSGKPATSELEQPESD